MGGLTGTDNQSFVFMEDFHKYALNMLKNYTIYQPVHRYFLLINTDTPTPRLLARIVWKPTKSGKKNSINLNSFSQELLIYITSNLNIKVSRYATRLSPFDGKDLISTCILYNSQVFRIFSTRIKYNFIKFIRI